METAGAANPQVFRPRLALALAMGGAGLLWAVVLVYLFQFEGVPTKTLLSAVFFVLFFIVAVLYYARTAIFVDQGGVTYRGMVRTQRMSFAEIRKVQVLPGPVTVYAIRANGRFVHFTSFFRHHRHLVNLLVERAGLSPL
jgi:hypothetical protein